MTTNHDKEPHRSRSSKKERSSRHQRNRSGSSHDNNNDDDERHRSSRPSSRRDGHHRKKKERRQHKDKTSNSNNGKQKSSRDTPPPPPKAEGGGGVTVSQFLTKQQSIQNEVSTYKNNSMIRQRMLYEQQFDDDDDEEEEEGLTQHYFDENDSDDDYNNNSGNSGAIVAHNNNRRTKVVVQQQVVDTLPADHPSSSTIQTHRTCSLCQRTLPRSQFSERDAYTINLSLSPSGITCRTCTMTVSAVKLKSMPETEQLLLDYASRGVQQGLLAIEQGRNQGQVAGYLTSNSNSSEMNNNNSGALIVRQDTAGSITGKELTLFNNERIPNNNNNNNNTLASMNINESYTNIMGLSPPSSSKDVNTTFSGRAYSHTDSDRPSNVANCKYIDALLQLPCYLNLNAFGIYTTCHDSSVSMSTLEAVRLYGTLDERYFVPHDVDGLPIVDEDDTNQKKKEDVHSSSLQTDEAQMNDKSVNPKSVVCIVLGEGATPRTAILASQHYGWTTIALDPNLSEDWDGCPDDIPNFTGYSVSISDFMDNESGEFNETLIEFRHLNIEHLIIIGIQHTKDTLRLKGHGHINEIRSRYDDVPTTLVSISPVRKATLVPTQRRLGQCGSKLEKDIGYEPNCSYIDESVFSDCRQVEVWNFHNAEGDDEDDSGEESQESSERSEYDHEDNDGEGKEEDYPRRRQSSIESDDYVNKKKKKERKNNNKRMEQPKKNAWLEDRVAEFKKVQKEEGDGNQAFDVSENTLSTKGTLEHGLERKLSRPIVDKPPGSVTHKGEMSPMSPMEEEGREQHPNDNHQDSPPDEDETNNVWAKAMAKHDEQEDLCNQFEQHYSGGDRNDDNTEEQYDPQHGLPPNWEAIFDPSSGEFYYNNYVTEDVTWDRPVYNEPGTAVAATADQEGHQEDQSVDYVSSYDDKKPAAVAAANDIYSMNMSDNDDSNYVFDDQSTNSSGIAALSQFDNRDNALGKSITSQPDEDEMIAWSDEEEVGGDQFNSQPPHKYERSGSSSNKKQPWHKKDSTETGNNDSFIYD